jgi:hypothetical protein
MKKRTRKAVFFLAGAVLIGIVVWAWRGLSHTSDATQGGRAAKSPSTHGSVPIKPMEPIQFHLIPRTQPTPLSPSGQQ